MSSQMQHAGNVSQLQTTALVETRLLVTGKLWPKVFEIGVVAHQQAAELADGVSCRRNIAITLTTQRACPEGGSKLVVGL
jgi:hypothetical protein